jgi:hypothetical protein
MKKILVFGVAGVVISPTHTAKIAKKKPNQIGMTSLYVKDMAYRKERDS